MIQTTKIMKANRNYRTHQRGTKLNAPFLWIIQGKSIMNHLKFYIAVPFDSNKMRRWQLWGTGTHPKNTQHDNIWMDGKKQQKTIRLIRIYIHHYCTSIHSQINIYAWFSSYKPIPGKNTPLKCYKVGFYWLV